MKLLKEEEIYEKQACFLVGERCLREVGALATRVLVGMCGRLT